MSSNYYYLVASLPKIAFDLEQKDVNILALKEEVKENIPASDYAYVDMLFTPYDINNLPNKILERKLPFSEKGRFTEEQFDIAIERPKKRLPSFMGDFVAIYKGKVEAEDEEEQARHEYIHSEPEVYLYTQFYNKATTSRNKFIRDWFTIDRDIRNILAAISARRLGMDREKVLIGEGEVIDALAKSTATDFGLRPEIDYMDRLLQIAEVSDMLERERQLDTLRLELADNLSVNHYFDIDFVLSLLLRADIVDRWLRLDKKIGTAMFRQILKDIQAEFDIQQALSQDPVLRGVDRR
ncbi:MAG: DUF2764 domain-containing protein [Prevotellaceae bacterium]|jgi:hypothetical protein|nr:DUF2764 domain-containing protein [Prevotellaceae bacterium]